jgi:hypothetical protein
MKPEHFSIELMFPCPECGDVIGTFVPLETYTQDVEFDRICAYCNPDKYTIDIKVSITKKEEDDERG